MRRPPMFWGARSVLALALAFSTGARDASAQVEVYARATPRLPFGPGEVLEYRVNVSIAGNVGTGVMRVELQERSAAAAIWVLHSEIEAGRGFIRANDRTTSWLDPARFAITRFEKFERHPLSRSEERVVINVAAGTFTDSGSPPAPLGSPRPLDELSFVYLLRTLPLDRDTTFTIERHFDPARNPTVVRVLGEEVISTPAGIFRTRIVEMDVKDPKRFRGTGTIRLNIDVGGCRVPVRIESRMPPFGTTTLLLTGWAHPPRYPAAFWCEG